VILSQDDYHLSVAVMGVFCV